MSQQSTASVMPLVKDALAALSPEVRKFRANNRRCLPASTRTILDYEKVRRFRPLTEVEKCDLYEATEIERNKSKYLGGRAIQTGINCGVYALKPLVRCQG
jgi:hypothetical protein